MHAALLAEIEKLRRATLRELREKYRELFQEDCRSRHREHVFRRLAWRLQALGEGDLPEARVAAYALRVSGAKAGTHPPAVPPSTK
jgi:FKBP-type peptidyl-prolyl cis-trans isomerase (trigger factor)